MSKEILIAAAAVMLLAGPAMAAPKGPASLDANADGKVTLSEFQAGRGDQMMDRLDADKNGKLSRAEFAAMRKPAADASAPDADKPGKGADRLWSRVDSDNDDALTRSELDSFLANRFKRMDADNDGTLSTAELKPRAGKAKVGI